MKKVLFLLIALNSILNGHSQSNIEYWERGNIQFDSGHYTKAIVEYNKYIEKDQNFVVAYFCRAGAKRLSNDFKGAIEDYTKVIKLHSTFKEAYCYRGLSKSNQNNHMGALADFNTAIKISPKYSEAYYHRGLEKIILTQLKSGCLDLQKAKELGFEKATEAIIENCNYEGTIANIAYTT